MKKPEDTVYGSIAIKAVKLIYDDRYSPENAWKIAVKGKEKGCPRAAFLGLCFGGFVVDVKDIKQTKLTKNGDYAVTAVNIISTHPDIPYSSMALWRAVGENFDNFPKTHNGQMHVVLALKNMEFLDI
ncbi:hypothetical protein SOASR032_05460 [Pragia fontium]|uniref:Uncharacterized protein n=1 Tax=Pragia fontium TaxID=82985 RepID=A0ABQ5LG62_9GAMM|nr:hypothetical protein [Pragia fontium]GKX61977.1 hypothetical protein SOASR032_05460 [Pragia fontium]